MTLSKIKILTYYREIEPSMLLYVRCSNKDQPDFTKGLGKVFWNTLIEFFRIPNSR